jgi:gag-polypeptide of LTR copia-type
MDVDDTSDEIILENQAKALTYIRLYLGDGPLLQTRQVTNPRELWKKLKTLYEPKGFSSDFLLCKDLFDTTLAKCGGSIEKYLNKIIKLNDDLIAHSIIIPNKVIAAWALNHLTPEYEQTVTIISQTFRAKTDEINIKELFSQLLDESRRLKSKEPKDIALVAKTSSKRAHDKPKCSYCKKSGHNESKC